MNAKFSHVRQDLEAARGWLDDSEELDAAVALVLDQIIETVLNIEHMKDDAEIIRFPTPSTDKGGSSSRSK